MNNDADVNQAAADFHVLFLLPVPVSITYNELVAWLTVRINLLLREDFNKLIHLLYRLDISEEKLRYLLAQNKGELAATIIAGLMIERQVQKIETRRLFKKDENIAEDEKW